MYLPVAAIGAFILLVIIPVDLPYDFIGITNAKIDGNYKLLHRYNISRTNLDTAVILLLAFLCMIPTQFREITRYLIKKHKNSNSLITSIVLLGISTCFASQPKTILASYQLLIGTGGVLIFIYISLHYSYLKHLFTTEFSAKHSRIGNLYNAFSNTTSNPFIVGTSTFIITVIISFYVYETIPYNSDSIGQLMHAKLLLQNKWFAIPHEFSDWFESTRFLQKNGRWFSPFAPGNIFSLLVGLKINAPWIIGPVSGFISSYYITKTSKLCFNKNTASITGLLLLLSPFYFLTFSEYLDHAVALAGFSIFTFYYIQSLNKKATTQNSIFSGIGLGICLLTRPLTALGLSIPFIALSTYRTIFKRIDFIKNSILCSIVLFSILIFAYYNFSTTGNFLVSGYEFLQGKSHNPGFGPIPNGEVHTFWKGLGNSFERLVLINKHLFGWPVPSLTFIALLFGAKKGTNFDKLFIFSFLGLLIAYLFYWYFENFFGPRFLIESSGVLIILTARGVIECFKAVRKYSSLKVAQNISLSLALLLSIFSILFSFPAEIRQRLKYWNKVAPIVLASRTKNLNNSVIYTDSSNYHSAFVENSTDIFEYHKVNDNTLIIWVLNKKDKSKMIKLYPKRKHIIAKIN